MRSCRRRSDSSCINGIKRNSSSICTAGQGLASLQRAGGRSSRMNFRRSSSRTVAPAKLPVPMLLNTLTPVPVPCHLGRKGHSRSKRPTFTPNSTRNKLSCCGVTLHTFGPDSRNSYCCTGHKVPQPQSQGLVRRHRNRTCTTRWHQGVPPSHPRRTRQLCALRYRRPR